MENCFASKKIGFLLVIISCACIAVQAQLVITPGAYVTTNGSSTIVLENTSLVNNGIITHASGTFKFAGSNPAAISGIGTTHLYNLELSRSAGTALRLSKNIAVQNQLLFTSGLVDLNGYNVDLLSTGALVNETEANRITGNNGGYVLTTANLSAPASANPGNLGAVISSTQNLGAVSIRRSYQAQANVGTSTGTGINRYFDISPANNTALNATLRFTYFDAELNGHSESDLVLYKSSDHTNWTSQAFTARDASLNYVEKTGITDFSRWTLGTATSNCDGMQVFYQDTDGDGFGNAGVSTTACSQPAGYAANSTDCDDDNASINPAAKEVCNGKDDDCDGTIDEECNTTTPALSISDMTVLESQGTVTLTVTLSAPSASTVTVKYQSVNGTARHPKDFTRMSGDLVFAPGETLKTVIIQIKPDNISEPDEWFEVQLSEPQNAIINDGTSRIIITEAILTDRSRTKKSEAYFDVTVARNPTNSYFILSVKTKDPEPLQISVTDVYGRLIERRDNVMSFAISVGNNLSRGVYFADIKQGNQRKIVKLIKL